MKSNKEETASFVVRFTQKIFEDEQGESHVQWRGNIRHVQGGDEKRFTEFKDVVQFIQEKLTSLAVDGMDEKSKEEKKSLLTTSFELWKQMASNTPKMVMEAIMDPKKQIAEFQERIHQVNENINVKLAEIMDHKVELDNLRTASKSDFNQIMERLDQMSGNLDALSQKVNQLAEKQPD